MGVGRGLQVDNAPPTRLLVRVDGARYDPDSALIRHESS